MKTLTMILTITIFFLLFPALSGIAPAQPAINPADGGCRASTRSFILAQSDYGGEFDLNYCQWECRMRFGYEPTGSGIGGGMHSDIGDSSGAYGLHQSSGTFNAYAACIADCNRKFWEEFEKKTGQIGKTR